MMIFILVTTLCLLVITGTQAKFVNVDTLSYIDILSGQAYERGKQMQRLFVS